MMKIIHPIFPSSMEVTNRSLSRVGVTKEMNKNLTHATITISPLEPGLGQSIGNLLRKLLSRFSAGSAITSVWISGIKHELSPLDGVQEDLTSILYQISQISLKMDNYGPGRIFLKKNGPGIITSDDLIPSPGVQIMSKSLYLLTLDIEGSIWMVLNVETGKGNFENKNIRLQHYKKQFLDQSFRFQSKNTPNEYGTTLSVSSRFSPVLKSSYEVRHFTHYDELIFDIETNGSISALESFESAFSFFLQKFLQVKLESSSMIKKNYTI